MLDYRGGANKVSDPARVRRVASAADQAYYKEAWLLAWRRKGLILALTTLGALGGFVASKTLYPAMSRRHRSISIRTVCQAWTRKIPRPTRILTGFINFVETQAKLLTSRLVLDRVVTREGLATDPEFRGDESSFLSTLLGRSPFSAKDFQCVARSAENARSARGHSSSGTHLHYRDFRVQQQSGQGRANSQ